MQRRDRGLEPQVLCVCDSQQLQLSSELVWTQERCARANDCLGKLNLFQFICRHPQQRRRAGLEAVSAITDIVDSLPKLGYRCGAASYHPR